MFASSNRTRNSWLLPVLALALAAGTAVSAPISVNGYRFDPPVTSPQIPANLEATPSDGLASYLVQFSGPIEESWKLEVAATGASLHGYIPENAFLVRMTALEREKVERLPFVRWVGPYHVAYRISPSIGTVAFRDPDRAADPLRTLRVIVSEDPAGAAQAAQSLGSVTERIDNGISPGFVIRIDPARIPELAALSPVLWVEELFETTVDNLKTRWVVQSNSSSQLTIWSNGIRGQGQILGIMDSGLDYNSCWFRDSLDAPPGPTHRKVIAYQTVGGGVAYDGCNAGHGTHTSGTAVGDQSFINPGVIDYNGMAYQAKLIMQDVGSDNATACTNLTLSVPADLVSVFQSAYDLGARVHSNSWGGGDNTYTDRCRQVDAFMWNHPDFLLCFANGNGGPGEGTVHAPGTSKNCVSVGATRQAFNQESVAWYSSHGPCADGRRKPTVMAPGGDETVWIYSADNNTANPPVPTCHATGTGFMGTSMATPAVAGCALLIRDYLAQGFYPAGLPIAPVTAPSAALVKAMLVNSGDEMGAGDEPNHSEGWGRILLNDVLYFSGDTRELRLEDVTTGLATGEEIVYYYDVDSDAVPLEISLVWTDFPATPPAMPALVNNLHLSVTSPSAIEYLGNVYSGGESTTGGTADNLNVEECVRRNAPEIGTWTIRVSAANVPSGPQPFALVTTGAFANWPDVSSTPEPVSPRSRARLEPARPNPFHGRTTLGFSLSSASPAKLEVFNVEGRRLATLVDATLAAGSYAYEWDAAKTRAHGAVFFAKLTTPAGTETRKFTMVR